MGITLVGRRDVMPGMQKAAAQNDHAGPGRYGRKTEG